MYQMSIPLISPNPHEVNHNSLEKHPLMGQVDTKTVLWYDNINYNVMIYSAIDIIVTITPKIDCMHLMSLQHDDEAEDDSLQPP